MKCFDFYFFLIISYSKTQEIVRASPSALALSPEIKLMCLFALITCMLWLKCTRTSCCPKLTCTHIRACTECMAWFQGKCARGYVVS